MYKVKKSSNPFYIESNQTFRQIFLVNLNKLNESSTKKTGLDEIRDLLSNHVQDADRINLVLTLLSENSDHQKASGKRETMKVIGIMAEVFEEKLANFIPKILQILSKKLKENDPQMHDTLSASIGSLVSFTVRHLELDAGFKNLQAVFTMLFQLCSKGNRYTQIGSAMCVTKVIQQSPFEFLYTMVDDITAKAIEVLRQHTCKAHIQLFECLLSLILAFEGNGDKLHESAKGILPIAIDNLTNGDWNVRKIAVELIYTLSMLVPEAIRPYKHELLDVLGHCRFDKIKNVRESSTTAIARIKDIEDPEFPAKLFNLNTEHNENIPDHEHRTATFADRNFSSEQNEAYKSLQGSEVYFQSGKWARNSPRESREPRERKQSPGNRPGLKANPDFFNNAPKHKGDIEIYTKSPPPREFIAENSAKKQHSGQKNEPNIQIQSSPNRTFKYIISNQAPNDYDENENGHQENREDSKGYKNFKFELLEKKGVEADHQQHQREERIRPALEERFNREEPFTRDQRESQHEEEISDKVRKISVESNQQPIEIERRKQAVLQPEPEQAEQRISSKYSNEDFDNVFKQLLSISEQQAIMMEKLTGFQGTTQSELHYLRSRVKYLEDFIQKAYHPPKGTPGPGYAYPPPQYAYMAPYQSFVQPPQYPQMQYANYIPPPGYQTQGGPSGNQPRNVDPNYMSRSVGGPGRVREEGYFSGKQSKERGMERAGHGLGDRMEQESPYPQSSKEKQRNETRWEPKGNEQGHREDYEASSRGRSRQMSAHNILWGRLQEFVSKNEINSAYELCLNEGDEETVLSLMRETGNIVEYLDIAIVENMFINLKSRVFDDEHRDMVLNWVEKALHEKLEISRGTWIALHDVIVQLLEEGAKISSLTAGRVKKLVKEISLMLDNTMPIENSQAREIEEMNQNENFEQEEEVQARNEDDNIEEL